MKHADRTDLYALDLSTAVWRKATASGGEGNCVEVAELPGGGRAVRDSKRPELATPRCTATEWDAFQRAIVAGEL